MAFLPFKRQGAAAAYANKSSNLYTQPLIVKSFVRESRESFFAALFSPSLGTAGKTFFPANPYFPPLARPAGPVAPRPAMPVPPTPAAAGPASPTPGEAPAGSASGYEYPQSYWSRPSGQGKYQVYHNGRPTGILSQSPVNIPAWGMTSGPAGE